MRQRTRRMLHPPLLAVGAALALLPSALAAQNGRIVGRVTNAETGAPISEVQVFLPGTGLGGLTRQNGAFVILEVSAGTHEIRAERIGLGAVSQQVTVAAGQVAEVNLQMATQALGLDEIVVTGTAGAARRREIGNSISQINTVDLTNRPSQVTDLLKGSAPGVVINGQGGELGQGQQIRLRGNGSVSMSNTPIIYIDGVRMQSQAFPWVGAPDGPGRGGNVVFSPLNTVNPNDIERIEVIKGSAATTLYGTEASAGVIQIFTKRGSAGAPVWTAETQQGAVWMRKFGPEQRPYFLMDPWLKTGHTQDYSLSVRGGGEALQYFTSAQHSDEQSARLQDEGDVWSVRGNYTFSPANDLQLQWNSGFMHRWQKNMSGSNNAHGVELNAMRAEVNYFGEYDVDLISQLMDYDVQTTLERFTTGGTMTYSPLATLTNRFTVGYDYSQRAEKNLRPFGFALYPQGALYVTNWENRLLTFDYAGTLAFDVMSGIRSNFSWGGQAIGEETHMYIGWARDFPGAKSPTLSSASQREAQENHQKVWNAGFFFQNVFDIHNRYFITVGMRVDGNSAFGENFGLQMYPKASASWVISDEGFWPEAGGQLKLRAAYGQSGRAPGAFDAVRTWTAAGWAGVPAFVPQNVGNPDLGPEVSGEVELGFDGSWFGDRLSSTFTYYNETTTDALFEVVQVPTLGFRESQLANVGKLRNSGLEVGVNGSPLVSADWRWDLGANVTTNHSKVLSLGGAPPFNLAGTGWIVEGQPVPVMRGPRVVNEGEAAAPILEDDYNYGPNQPTLVLGLSTTVAMPFGISVSARGEYQGGHWMAIGPGRNTVNRGGRFPACFPYYAVPEPMEYTPLTDTKLRDDTPAEWRARCTPGFASNDAIWHFPRDFFRLRSVSAEFPLDVLTPEWVDSSTLSLSLNDSWSWLKDFPVYDPEMTNRDSNEPVVTMTDRLPTPITFRTSVRLTF